MANAKLRFYKFAYILSLKHAHDGPMKLKIVIKFAKNTIIFIFLHKKSLDTIVSKHYFQFGGAEGTRTPVYNNIQIVFYTFILL